MSETRAPVASARKVAFVAMNEAMTAGCASLDRIVNLLDIFTRGANATMKRRRELRLARFGLMTLK